MEICGVEEQAMVAEIVPLCNYMEVSNVFEHVSWFGGNGVPIGPVPSSLLHEYLRSFSYTMPLSLFDPLILVRIEGESSFAGRRRDRLDRKNKDCCNILAAKLTKYRLAESFGGLS
jgi:hypothetical protein